MSKKALFSKYLKGLSAVAIHGDAREESFYPTLASMLAEVANASGRTHIRVTTLPKPTDAGNPDFRLWKGKDHIIGYIEAKKQKSSACRQRHRTMGLFSPSTSTAFPENGTFSPITSLWSASQI